MKKLLFCLSFMLISTSIWAENLTVTPHSVVRLSVSNREPNVIAVMNDRIVEANSAAGKLADKKATDSGALIFTTEETTPFSLYIETEKGFGFTVNAIPVKKSQGINVSVMNAEAKADANAQEWGKTSDSYSQFITRTFTAAMNDNIPTGFVKNGRVNVNWSASALANFRFRDSVSFQGKNIRLLRVNVENKTSQPIQLNERVFWVPQTMAIAFNPTVNTLRPHEQVTLFLLIKEKPE
ncbi:TraK domain-containing protein [Arsenophonus nasoniae]|uniref:Type-F conjugative transfer system secretin TraK n=1 Tax=Arsenophonus nasoniae TaxID=638 RepID=A0AA95GU45_9GAMM|nr:type-F conjugative transfer system secretin TraK [Arsenophonus nasoniae]WGL93857.1 type-F conjugative transfer system secretin TraK [Arsenophonus nasoniae]WGM03316.1 type-F conjugative transfer system secretin TraK [Arsenophonus nasoniae]WGM08841.1 type-F conjugative transfer system secretin TraK [Arsenophonus nasoniae]